MLGKVPTEKNKKVGGGVKKGVRTKKSVKTIGEKQQKRQRGGSCLGGLEKGGVRVKVQKEKKKAKSHLH